MLSYHFKGENMSYKTNVLVTKEDDWYVASSIETNVASQGKTVEEAIENLKEALELYFEDSKNDNTYSNICYLTIVIIVFPAKDVNSHRGFFAKNTKLPHYCDSSFDLLCLLYLFLYSTSSGSVPFSR